MPRNGKKGKTGKSGKKSLNPAAQSLVYRGPIKDPKSMQEDDTISSVLSWTGLISSDGTGSITAILSNDPSASADFSSFVNTYDDFRVLGEKLEFFPINRYSKVTTTCVPLIVVKDRNDSAILTTYSSAISYSSASKRSVEDPWSESFKMVGANESVWISTASPVASRWFKFFGTGYTNYTDYGRFFLYARVQFRGRK
jgi:hypothetical protein